MSCNINIYPLVYNGAIVAKRLKLYSTIGYSTNLEAVYDCSSITLVSSFIEEMRSKCKVSEINSNIRLFEVGDSLKSKEGCENISVEIEPSNYHAILKSIEKKLLFNKNACEKANSNFYILCSKLLRAIKGSVLVFDDDVDYDKENLEMCIRFLGGYGAWSGSEDICDADILDRTIGKKVESIVSKFNKDISPFMFNWSIGEKAYSYFSLSLK